MGESEYDVMEAHFYDNQHELVFVDMFKSASTSDDDKVIGTLGLGPCVSIAAALHDGNNLHRFVSHSLREHKDTVAEFAEFLNSLGEIEQVRVILVSGLSFRKEITGNDDFKKIAEQSEADLLDGVKKVMQPYKDKNKNFVIEFSPSFFVKILPSGEFVFPEKGLTERWLGLEEEELSKPRGFPEPAKAQ